MRIVGFGACMINGYPFESSSSFFNIFINFLKNYSIESEIVSLGGFTIDRALKRGYQKVLSLNPDVVILQFGSSDMDILFWENTYEKLRLKYIRQRSKSKMIHSQFPYKPSFEKAIKSHLRSLICFIFNFHPRVPIIYFIKCLEEIVSTLSKEGIKVIVISPFVCTKKINNYLIEKSIKEIKKLNQKHDFLFVDCYKKLKVYDFKEILLEDGFHLSKRGHEIVANELLSTVIDTLYEGELLKIE